MFDEIGADRVVDAGVLHLHRDLATGVRHRAVHLADRRGRDRARDPTARTRARGRRRARRARPARSARATSAARPAAATRARRAPARACRRRGSSPSGRASSARPSCSPSASRDLRGGAHLVRGVERVAPRLGRDVARGRGAPRRRVPGPGADRGELGVAGDDARRGARPRPARRRRPGDDGRRGRGRRAAPTHRCASAPRIDGSWRPTRHRMAAATAGGTGRKSRTLDRPVKCEGSPSDDRHDHRRAARDRSVRRAPRRARSRRRRRRPSSSARSTTSGSRGCTSPKASAASACRRSCRTRSTRKLFARRRADPVRPQPDRLRHVRADDRHARQRRAEAALPAPAVHRRRDLVPDVQRAGRRLRRRGLVDARGPRRRRVDRSTVRRCGRRSRTSRASAS